MTAAGQDPFDTARAEPGGASRIVQELARLGPVQRRIFHYLATCPDVLAAPDREALIDLGDHVPPLPWPAIRAALADSLGTDLSEVFAEVEPSAAWANGIAQLHRARLPDSTPVTVKVVRPRAHAEVSAALRWLDDGLPSLLEGSEVPAAVLEELAGEVAAWLSRQTDLTIEATNLHRLRELAAGSEWEHVPLPYLELCSESVLVAEDAGGTRLTDIAGSRPARLREAGVDRVRLARAIETVLIRQAFRYRLFQTDLHPDNVLALPGDIVTFADWSSFGQLDPALADDELAYLSAVFESDIERSLDPPGEVAALDADGDLAAFRRDLLRVVRARATADSERPSASAPVEFLAELLRAAAAHRVALPRGARLLHRSLVTAESAARRVDPAVDTVDVVSRSLGVARVGVKLRKLQPERVEATLSDVARLLRDLPGQAQKILADLADGSFSLNVWVAEVAQAERNRNRRTRLLVAAIASVSLATLLSAPHLAEAGGVSLAWPVAVALVAVYGWLLLEWRRLR
jgi:ubiquinone biosynthesis protein